MAPEIQTYYESVPSEVTYLSEDASPQPSPLLKNFATKKQGRQFGKRHGQILICTILVFLASSTRVDMSVCIVAMNDPTASANKDVKTFNWTDKSLVLSSFLWGYMLPQTATGWLASRYGPKWLLVFGMTTCSLLGLLLPTLAITLGSHGVMACRCMQGICQSCVFPSVQALLGKWAPTNERSRLGSFVHAGGPSGMLTGTLLSGYIASSWYGWTMVFYVLYSALLLWSMLFACIGSNSPADHTTITREEKLYIQSNLNQEKYYKNLPTPWSAILKSVPFWALVITQAGYTWGYWTLLAEIPVYMSSVMKFSIEANGVLSSAPYLAQWILAIFFSFLSDWLINRQICSIGATRKSMNMIGLIIPAVALVVLGKCGAKDPTIAVGSLIVAGGISSACLSGHTVNHMDLSPNHSGILMGIANQAAIVFSVLAPMLVQYWVINEEDPDQWSKIFYLASAFYAVSTIIFTVFGSGEVQPWNDVKM